MDFASHICPECGFCCSTENRTAVKQKPHLLQYLFCFIGTSVSLKKIISLQGQARLFKYCWERNVGLNLLFYCKMQVFEPIAEWNRMFTRNRIALMSVEEKGYIFQLLCYCLEHIHVYVTLFKVNSKEDINSGSKLNLVHLL